jgi:hypothetical protein
MVLRTSTAKVLPTNVPKELESHERRQLIERNAIESQLPRLNSLEKCSSLHIVSGRDVDRNFGYGGDSKDQDLEKMWDAFHSTFKGANGVISVSLPGYSDDGKSAVVYVTTSCGSLCGHGYYVELKSESGAWRQMQVIQGWVSRVDQEIKLAAAQ